MMHATSSFPAESIVGEKHASTSRRSRRMTRLWLLHLIAVFVVATWARSIAASVGQASAAVDAPGDGYLAGGAPEDGVRDGRNPSLGPLGSASVTVTASASPYPLPASVWLDDVDVDLDRCYRQHSVALAWDHGWDEACRRRLENVTEYAIARKHLSAMGGAQKHAGRGDVAGTRANIEAVQAFDKYVREWKATKRKERDAKRRQSLGAEATGTLAAPLLLPRSEWLEDIDTAAAVVGCGWYKCAYRSKTSPWDAVADGDRVGYLVSDRALAHNRTFSRAQALSKKYDVRHTLLAAALKVNVTTNRTIWVSKNKQVSRGILYVQPIELYPEHSVLFKCKQRLYMEAMGVALMRTPSPAVDPRAFERRLRTDLDRTMAMMARSRRARCLFNDFQLVLDAAGGRLFHLDLDRCFQRYPPAHTQVYGWDAACRRRLENATEYMIARQYLAATEGAGDRGGHGNAAGRLRTHNKTVEAFEEDIREWGRTRREELESKQRHKERKKS